MGEVGSRFCESLGSLSRYPYAQEHMTLKSEQKNHHDMSKETTEYKKKIFFSAF